MSTNRFIYRFDRDNPVFCRDDLGVRLAHMLLVDADARSRESPQQSFANFLRKVEFFTVLAGSYATTSLAEVCGTRNMIQLARCERKRGSENSHHVVISAFFARQGSRRFCGLDQSRWSRLFLGARLLPAHKRMHMSTSYRDTINRCLCARSSQHFPFPCVAET